MINHQKTARLHTPLGLWVVILLLLALIASMPFRMPSLSQARSNDFYKVHGQNTRKVLESSGKEINKTINIGENQTIVSATPIVPERDSIDILLAKGKYPDISSLEATFFIGEDATSDYVEDVPYPYAYYTLTQKTLEYPSGTLELSEDGYMRIKVYGISERGITEDRFFEALSFMLQLSEVFDIKNIVTKETLILPNYDGFPICFQNIYDADRKQPSSGGGFAISSEDDSIDFRGIQYDIVEKLWENVKVISASDALSSACAEIRGEAYITSIILMYHPRLIYANPLNVILYPVWFFSNTEDSTSYIILNAITGDVEANGFVNTRR